MKMTVRAKLKTGGRTPIEKCLELEGPFKVGEPTLLEGRAGVVYRVESTYLEVTVESPIFNFFVENGWRPAY